MQGLALLLLCLAAETPPVWLQWGGPARDFQLDSDALQGWPANGPKQLWKRELGDGYSSIVTDGKTAYTLFKRGTDTVVVALEAATERTVWEKTFDAKPAKEEEKDIDPVHGTAPASTPIVAGDSPVRDYVHGTAGRSESHYG